MEGTYRVRDLTDIGRGNLYEGKVIVEKNYGHAAYGCAECCGYNQPFMEFNPLGVPVAAFSNQNVQAHDACGSFVEYVTGAMTRWWTANSAIATAPGGGRINGIPMGATPHCAAGTMLFGKSHSINGQCPQTNVYPQALTKWSPFQRTSSDECSRYGRRQP